MAVKSLIPALAGWSCFYTNQKYNNYSFKLDGITYYINPCFSNSTGKLTGWSLTAFFHTTLNAGYRGFVKEQQHNDDYIAIPNKFYSPTFSRADSAAKFVRIMHTKILNGEKLNYYAPNHK